MLRTKIVEGLYLHKNILTSNGAAAISASEEINSRRLLGLTSSNSLCGVSLLLRRAAAIKRFLF